MLKRIKPRLSFANVVAMIALFAALGGTVYAANKINGKTIKKNSIPANRLKADKVGGKQVNESKLAFSCPSGTQAFAGSCVETSVRAAVDFFDAAEACAAADRRLPTAAELVGLEEETGIVSATEVSSNIYASDTNDFEYISVANGGVVDDLDTGTLNVYRCVASPINVG